MKNKNVLILDESTWRCGRDAEETENSRGKGPTALLNEQGYMCCLGQFSLQLAKLKKEQLLMKSVPMYVDVYIPFLTRKSTFGIENNEFIVPPAIEINDNECTSVDEKVEKLKELFSKHGYEIKFIPTPWYKKLWKSIKNVFIFQNDKM